MAGLRKNHGPVVARNCRTSHFDQSWELGVSWWVRRMGAPEGEQRRSTSSVHTAPKEKSFIAKPEDHCLGSKLFWGELPGVGFFRILRPRFL